MQGMHFSREREVTLVVLVMVAKAEREPGVIKRVER